MARSAGPRSWSIRQLMLVMAGLAALCGAIRFLALMHDVARTYVLMLGAWIIGGAIVLYALVKIFETEPRG